METEFVEENALCNLYVIIFPPEYWLSNEKLNLEAYIAFANDENIELHVLFS
jgi:hypothetical protein